MAAMVTTRLGSPKQARSQVVVPLAPMARSALAIRPAKLLRGLLECIP